MYFIYQYGSVGIISKYKFVFIYIFDARCILQMKKIWQKITYCNSCDPVNLCDSVTNRSNPT